jgi:hypothetical protein
LGAGLNAVERGRGVGAFYSLGEGGEAVAGVGGLLMSPVTGRRSESGTGEGNGQGSHAGRGMGRGTGLPSCTEECGGWLRPGVAAVATVSKWEQEVRDDPQMGWVAGHKAGSRWANAGKIKERNCAARDKEVE